MNDYITFLYFLYDDQKNCDFFEMKKMFIRFLLNVQSHFENGVLAIREMVDLF